MGTDFPGKMVVLVGIALTPAVLRWWWGRRLLVHADDPALAERLVATARRSGAVSGISLVLLVALSPRATAWTLPLLIFGRLVAAYPSRRALFEEQWTLAGYVSFWLRLAAGGYGLWLLIALVPLIVPLAGTLDWLAAILLAAALLAWSLRSSEIVRRILHSQPIDDPVLLRRFRAMIRARHLSSVAFERVDLHGGSLANAIALPSLRSPMVLFSDPLLATLSQDEIVAICAHEIAHLEYFNPARVRRMQIGNAVLIVMGAAIVPVVRATGIHTHGLATLGWYVVLFAEAAWRARDRQRNETASDQRAVALCGDADALIRGLTRLYTRARVPRRLDPQIERQATHPSLAKRIRDIRRIAGLSVSALSEDARFVAPDGVTSVTFQPDRLNWAEGEAASHILSYAHLSEVRVATPHSGPPSLVVVERGGRRWTMALDGDDVGRAQTVLDVVDGRLAEPPTAPRVRPALSRAFAALAALLALPVGHVGAFVLAILVSLRPSSPLLAGAGLGTLAAAAITIHDHGIVGPRGIVAVLMALVGTVLLLIARATRHDPTPPRTWWAISAVAIGAALSLALMTLDGVDAVTLHQSARAMSAPLVLSIAAAGTLLWTGKRAAIIGAVAAAIVAGGVSIATSASFLERFGHDPFLSPAGSIRLRAITLRTATELRLPFSASSARLSPGARVIAVATGDDDGGGAAGPSFQVGKLDGTLRPIAASDLRFVDDERILVIATAPGGLDVREMTVAPPNRVLWTVHLQSLVAPRLFFNRDDMSWRVIGWNPAREIVRYEGQLGDVASRESRWPLGAASDGYIAALAAAGDAATAVESRYERTTFERVIPARFGTLLLATPRMVSTVRTVGSGGQPEMRASRFGTQCVADPMFGRELVCSVFDGTDTRIVTLSARGEVKSVGTIPATFMSQGLAARDWVLGWAEGTALALRLSTREAFQIGRTRGEFVTDVGDDGRTFATIGYGVEGGIVRVYSMDGR